MKITEQYTYNFPTYALSALFNGDYSGIDDEDIENLEAFLERESYIDVWDCEPDEEPSFTPHPEFGLACDCITVIGTVFEKETTK